MKVGENVTYTPPTIWSHTYHPVVDIGGQEYAVNKQTHTVDKESLNKQLEQQQIAYVNAKARGDKQGMEQAAKNGAELRANGADLQVSDEAATLQRYYDHSGVNLTISNHSVQDLNKGIVQAKNDYAWAKAHNDQAGMAAAAQVAANYRAMGGTIGSDVSLVDAQKMVNQPAQTATPANQSTKSQSTLSYETNLIGGGAYSFINNASFGALHALAPDDVLTDNKAYVQGKVGGDAVSIAYGVSNGLNGLINTGGGIILTASGAGAPVGVPLAVEGLAQLTYGVFVTAKSASSLNQDNMTLSKLNSEEGSSGNTVGSGGSVGAGEVTGSFAGNLNTSDIPKMSKQEILDHLPSDWKVTENNGFVHVRDANGNIRMRIDPPDKVTQYDHVHLYDEHGNPLDVNLNIVDKKSTDAHIPYQK